MSYHYWIIRFVPDVARGEFSNVGIICGRDGRDWAVKFDFRSIPDHGGLRSGVPELSRWATWFRQVVDSHDEAHTAGRPQVNSGWLEHLRTRQANSIQLSAAVPVDVDSAEGGVALLFTKLVRRATRRTRHGLTRTTLRAEVRNILSGEADYVTGKNLFAGPTFSIGKQRGAFDFLRLDAPSSVVTNVWAFNIATMEVLERDIQSWNYLVGRFRNDGATLDLKSWGAVDLPSTSPVEVVYDPPATSGDARRDDIFEAALEAWSLCDVRARTLGDFHARTSAI